MNRHTPTRIAAAALFCAASSVYAQTLLTPAAAAAGNITPGDAPSYPITITKPGLYRLGADLTVPLGTNAIEVTVDNVTIDLNGYSIVSGERTCTQPQTAWTVTCNAFSVPHNYGIRGLSGLVVRNGRVQGFSTGIFFDGGGRMEDLILRYNDYGIWQLPNLTPANSMAGVHVARVLAEFNYSGGMTLWNGYVESSVLKNNNVGLYGSNWVSIASSAAYRNATGLYKTAASGNNVFDNQVDRREVREY